MVLHSAAHLGGLLVSLLLAGCAAYGPDSMRSSRIAYNQAVRESEQNELLLNLIRLRYSETPEFLAISGISTQMSFEGRGALAGTFGKDAGDRTTLASPGLSVGYQENPTVTFIPQRDVEFARQLMAPIEIDSLYLLSRQGWGIDRVLRLIAEDVNGVANSTTREARTEVQIAELSRFSGLAQDLRTMEQAGFVRIAIELRQDVVSGSIAASDVSIQNLMEATQANFGFVQTDTQSGYRLVRSTSHYVMQLDPRVWESPQFRGVLNDLALVQDELTIEIDPSGGTRSVPSGTLGITTRSVLGVLGYLSSGVEVPTEHLNHGLVEPENANVIAHSLLIVRVAGERPKDAYIAVPYRGYWFFVEDEDVETKRTFSLLMALIRLSINAGGAQNVPVLTLPVAR